MGRASITQRIATALSALLVVISCSVPSTLPPPRAGQEEDAGTDLGNVVVEEPDLILEHQLGPYFTDVLGGEAAVALAEDRLADALELFDEISSQVSDIILTPRARFMGAYLAELLGDDERALAELPALAEELPLVADLARERAARAALRQGKCDRAIDLASLVSDSSSFSPAAVLTRAESLRALGRMDQAAKAYGQYLERWPRGGLADEAKARIVQCRAAELEKNALTKEAVAAALELIDQLRAKAPASRWVGVAAAHEQSFLTHLGRTPTKHRGPRKNATQAYDKAAKLKRKMRNKQAEKAFDKVIRLARKNGDLACRARFERGMAIARQRQHGRAGEAYEEASTRCSVPGIRVRALYRGAKAFQSARRCEDAIRLYTAVENDFPFHSFADDARLHAGRCRLTLGDREGFMETLESIEDIYPAGDMRPEALWTLAYEALKEDDLVRAAEVLGHYYDAFPRESGWYAAGRSGYWLGRVTEKLGDVETASLRYEQVIAAAPFTFYMVLAYSRLAAIDRDRATALIADLAPAGRAEPLGFDASLLERFPTLAVGIELHRLGLETRARREIERLLGGSDLPPEVYWLSAALLRRAGRFAESRHVTARTDKSWNNRYPAGTDYGHWSLAFPPAYEAEVNAASEESKIPPALIWAVMREESGFNHGVESWANAIGLMQLILPTARSMGRKLDIRVNRRTLRNPEVNIRLGTAYLSHLEGKLGGHQALMISGYNAGEGAVMRWLKARPDHEIDLFVEEIPYDQTRGYTKRVIGTLATYMFLYEEGRPVLELPLNLLD